MLLRSSTGSLTKLDSSTAAKKMVKNNHPILQDPQRVLLELHEAIFAFAN